MWEGSIQVLTPDSLSYTTVASWVYSSRYLAGCAFFQLPATCYQMTSRNARRFKPGFTLVCAARIGQNFLTGVKHVALVSQ